MKKLLRYAILITICLVFLLGTSSFSILTCTNENAPKALFSFTQIAPGVASVSLLGYPMTWDLSPLLALREKLGDLAGDIPAKCVGAICSFFETVFDAFA